jgi:hypothetical protein
MRHLLDVLSFAAPCLAALALCGRTGYSNEVEPVEFVTTPTLVTCRDCLDALEVRRKQEPKR